jgi:hypothetical protein
MTRDMLRAMEERKACDHLKRRFESAGFKIAENVDLDEDGVRFEVDGFDATHRVGYEYVTAEAGDGWDVDAGVIAKLAARHEQGDLHILVIDEAAAPDPGALDREVDRFLAQLRAAGVEPAAGDKRSKTPAKKPPPTPAAAKKPAARPAAKKPAAKTNRKVKRR